MPSVFSRMTTTSTLSYRLGMPGIVRAGRTFASWTLSREYGFCDVDGERPDWGAYFEKKYGVPAAADYTSWRNGPFELATANGQPYHAE